MGASGTIPLPRGHPNPSTQAPHFPTPVPGGIGQRAPLPSRRVVEYGREPKSVPGPGGSVEGGQWGAVDLARGKGSFNWAVPWSGPLPTVGGSSLPMPVGRNTITFIRRYFPNTAGLLHYLAILPVGPNWSTNSRLGMPQHGAVSPFSKKRINWTLRLDHISTRELFPIRTVPKDQIQTPLAKNVSRYRAQAAGKTGRMSAQHYNRIANYVRAQSYGQTTEVIYPVAGSGAGSEASSVNMAGMGAY